MQKHDIGRAAFNATIAAGLDMENTAEANRCMTAPGLCIGSSSAAKVKIANTTTFLCGGIFKSKTSAEIAFTATTHDIPCSATLVQEAMYLLMLAADGTPSLVMGAIVAGSGNALLPERPATGTPIGAVRIAVAAGSTKFTAGSDLLSAGHLTVTYYDIGYIAPRFDTVQ